ncbi:MAG TPA: amidophosphoribosyltransferase [Candidatus Micrarchaeia archaeon]|nr:amidophosphoribosyltransferase [Candidatus Micrarchaeia archaeon]
MRGERRHDAPGPVAGCHGDDPDKPRDACGVFGVLGVGQDVASLTTCGLYALQHRGQESAGICVSDGERLRAHRDMGLVAQVFDDAALARLPGHLALGHTRYSTTGSPHLGNAQPFTFEHGQLGPMAIAHNGNLTNARALRLDLLEQDYPFQTSSDTEVLAALLARTPGDTLATVLQRALPRAVGAYSLGLITRDHLVAARDEFGFRPLCIGRLGDRTAPGGDGYVIASETCALDVIGAHFIRSVAPGEIVVIDRGGLASHRFGGNHRPAMCSFEFIYFARPDSVLEERSLYEVRRAMGRNLAREAPAPGDIVIPLPDSGTPAAIGYAEATGIPFAEGMIKSRYITRTFIQPQAQLREAGVRLKFNPMRHVLEGRRVVLVDDSIVRGSTSRQIVDALRRAGARAVHMRVASPPIRFPCFMGIDIASRSELIATGRTPEEVGRVIGADSLAYLSLAGLRDALNAGREGAGFCFACLDGAYPVEVPQQLEMDKLALEG